ncbi:MAG: nucleoside deaminase [Clostridia bacterium]|nr:nucleoside deaminase [Clostridia bacterium]
MSHDERWMMEAIREAQAALREDEVPVGAVVVKDDKIVARAHNLSQQKGDPTQHAELLALQQAQKAVGSLDRCTLYVTMEPCAMCAGAMVLIKLPRLVFGAFDPSCGCTGSRVDLTDHWFYHSVETWGGVLEKDCSALLTEFFQRKR